MSARDTPSAAWLPLVVILLAQIQLSFNINALPVSVGRIAEDLHTPATSIATAVVVYSLFVAALVMVGAKLGRLLGERLAFQIGVAVHAIAMGVMAFSADKRTMDNAQALAGLAAAVVIPTLVVLIAANFRGRQKALALGMLAGAQPVAGALAFFIAGFLGSTMGWRYSFGLLVFLAVIVAGGLMLLGFTIHNEWGTPTVIVALILTGLGEGSLLTLLFNLMVALSRRELAGDVGALRGVANNLSTAVGTGFASVVAVMLLSLYVTAALNRSTIPASLKGEVDLDNVNFITNAHLKEVLGTTSATPEQVNEAVAINEEARLRALKASFLILAAISLLAIFPALALPTHNPVLADAEPDPPAPGLVPDRSDSEA